MTQATDAILQEWIATEDAVRARHDAAGRSPSPVDPATLAALPGIEVFEKLLAGELPGAPIADTLDFTLVEAEPGRIVFQGTPLKRHYNPLGSVHGGWYATLLDSAVGCAVHSALPAGKAYTTLELKVNMVRALSERVLRVRAIGTTIHVGGQVATAEGRLVGPDGKLYAHASTTCLVFDARPAR